MPLKPDTETIEPLLDTLRAVVTELHPGLGTDRVITLDSSLDRDLALDSLGRMELLTRLERRFDISLPDSTIAIVETPRDLLRAIHSARPMSASLAAMQQELPELAETDTPVQASTLLDVLDWHVQAHAERPHIMLYAEDEQLQTISYGALLQQAEAVAGALQLYGLQPGGTVAIMLPTSRDYFFSYFGILLAGGVPVPIYPPVRLSQIEDHLRRHARILSNAQASLLITIDEARPVARLLKTHVPGLRQVVTPAELAAADGVLARVARGAEDLAFIQYTSGSTGHPKGVALSHANLVNNIQAMGKAVAASSRDVFVSWLPLYHDMGLIGAWLGSLYFAMPLVVMSPLAFLTRPQRWLWAIHRHKGTLSAAPNFAYELCLNKMQQSDLEGLDLSSWRLAFNGAEPVSPQTLRRFTERFSRYGLRPQSMAPVYGLAESSVGLAFPPVGRLPPIDRVKREPLERSGLARSADANDTRVLEFPACGQPLPGHQIRIVDQQGRELPDRQEGRLQFQGPSCTKGYYRNPEASSSLFDNEWLDSGDLAYMAGGDVYLTSRTKDIIIRAGRNIYPHEVEEVAGDIPGIRKGCVAVFGSTDARSQTEKLVVMAETRETDASVVEALRNRVHTVTTDLLGTPPDEVLITPPHTVLKTSSGKIRRAASRERYEQGDLSGSRRRVWKQFARLLLSSALPMLRRMRHHAAIQLYAGYCWVLFYAMAIPVWLSVIVLPRHTWRWALIHRSAKLLARLLGIPIRIEGIENLEQHEHYVIVANHASYLDGIILSCVLRKPVHFVAKGELRKKRVARLFLRAIGGEFVDRVDPRSGVEDTRRLTDLVKQSYPLFFFAEGTFTRMPGLLPFHMGGFVAAVEAGVPVIPLVIRGSRSLMRADTWMPRHGMVTVTISPPITTHQQGWSGALDLRDQARAEMLRHTGEPDLD